MNNLIMEPVINGEVLTKLPNTEDVQCISDSDEVIKAKNSKEIKHNLDHDVSFDSSRSGSTVLEIEICESKSNITNLDDKSSEILVTTLNKEDSNVKESLISDTIDSKTAVENECHTLLTPNIIVEKDILNKDKTSFLNENGLLGETEPAATESCNESKVLPSMDSEEKIVDLVKTQTDIVDKSLETNVKSLKRKLSVSYEPQVEKIDLFSSVSVPKTDIVDSVEKLTSGSNLNSKTKDEVKGNLVPAEPDLNTLGKDFIPGESIVVLDEEPVEKAEPTANLNSLDQETDFVKEIDINVGSGTSKNNSSICSDNQQYLDLTKNINQFLEKNETKPTSDSTNGLIDLSATKLPLENSSNKATPLEKLNEHVKSLESNSELKSRLSLKQAVDTSIVNLTSSIDSHVYDKENKCIDSSHSKDKPEKESSDSFVFADLSNEETGFPDTFTGLVTIGKYISVKGDFTLRSSEALVESPSLVAPYLLKEPDSFPSKDKNCKSEEKIKDFFHSAAGEILIGIGLSRVTEWFHKDMARIKKRQMKRNGKSPELEEELAKHEDIANEASKANHVYSFNLKSCKSCGFTTESTVVLEGHMLVPHLTPRKEFQCNYCDFINRDSKGIIVHMQRAHQKQAHIRPPVFLFECPFCVFESNSKGKLNNHLIKCQRLFDVRINQAPPRDFEFPALTPKPITVAVVKAYEKSLGCMQRGRGRPKKDPLDTINPYTTTPSITSLTHNHMPGFRSSSSNSPLTDSLSLQNQLLSPLQMPNMNMRPGPLHPGIPPLQLQPPPSRFFQVVNSAGQIIPLIGNNHLTPSPSQFPFSTNLNNSIGKKTPPTSYFNSVFDGNLRQQNPTKAPSPNVTITPLPKLTGPYPVPMSKSHPSIGTPPMQSNSLVVCEICDGYIKDLDQLRTHMLLIHKVKIHPKMLVSRPPLNCQKCQWRFFTDQGLERHLLGSHGLVTSNMHELSNKGKDAGCCTICGRVYATKLVSHMNQVHKITLKPAHLSYKCTVCSATFNLYRLFENHVYLVHSGAAKRAADGRSSPTAKKLKIGNDGDTDENMKMCKHCGSDMSNDKSLIDKCGKCLNSSESVKGTKT